MHDGGMSVKLSDTAVWQSNGYHRILLDVALVVIFVTIKYITATMDWFKKKSAYKALFG
ncbi:hypothetical protein [Moraxella lacunata]|uniref:hypothetical protein n=1 Tax=Moraxella lacunata TaxID=477 RepID=UPI003EE19D89